MDKFKSENFKDREAAVLIKQLEILYHDIKELDQETSPLVYKSSINGTRAIVSQLAELIGPDRAAQIDVELIKEILPKPKSLEKNP